MNFGTLVKVFDTAVALGNAASRMRGSSSGSTTQETAQRSEPAYRDESAQRSQSAARSQRLHRSDTIHGAEALEPHPPSPGVRGYLETRLTNVLVSALREAFDRDLARLELERTELEEQRSRAERALQMEMWRQAADRELGRLRLLAGAALLGWIASVAVLVMRLDTASVPLRVTMAVAWVLLLGALGTAFTAQSRINASAGTTGPPSAGQYSVAAMWMLLAGLALAASTLLFA